MAFPMSENEGIRAYGVPKNMLLEFRILSKPCSVVRDVTLAAVNTLDYASDRSSKDTRLILTGPSGCGKSYLLLQAVEYAVHNNWIVLYIPRAVNLVNSSTAYAYDARTRTYLQPDYSYELLRRFLSVNSAALHDLTLQEDVVLEDRTVPAGTLLADLVRLGVDRKELSAVVLPTLMEALSRQTTYPVFLAVDDVQSLFCATKYRDPHYRTVMPHHLAIPRLILEYASGKKTFARGAFFGAESTAETRFLMPLELREALGLPEHRPAGPYVARRPELAEYAAGLRNVAVPAQLSVGEAAALFEVWMEDQALHSEPNDELFMTKYSEAGGNARAFMWKGLLATLSSL
ncbi:hypothetical protein WOLCODRAFT_91935 [Wolfiporia cocos MD-104 SS10]|uniref:Small ribosomal subunit protein mS29 n=1 Tax=Wolfiporia cocos (strain MD-104) TaxID=742152 RepID=A0A2H3J1Y4_WOLCO|nr:hypothetical protein WOLCODRAFT_91935 [Wolfiporia cocos MD-104 SS10]